MARRMKRTRHGAAVLMRMSRRRGGWKTKSGISYYGKAMKKIGIAIGLSRGRNVGRIKYMKRSRRTFASPMGRGRRRFRYAF
jgi:hypothetical protein